MKAREPDRTDFEIAGEVPRPEFVPSQERASRLVRSLGPEELQTIEEVGQRMRSELSRLFQWLPQGARSVRTMAAFLNVDRNTCQRVISAVQPATSGCEAFIRLPGLNPLTELVRRAKSKGAPREVVAASTAAIERLVSVLDGLGESQARLKSRVTSSMSDRGSSGEPSSLDLRRSMFDDAARLHGRQLLVHSLTTAIRPHPEDPSKVEQAWMLGYIGLKSRLDATPLSLGLSSTDRHQADQSATFNPLSQTPAPQRRASGLVPSFSSNPLPTMTTRGPTGSMIAVVDPARTVPNERTDVAVATRISHVAHPTLQSPEVFHTSAVMFTPAVRLIFDVYLHRTLALASVPSVGAYQYSMSFSEDPEENWPFRIPGRYVLEMLGLGLQNSGHLAWERQKEAAEYLFAQTGWATDDYVGHRLDVLYPPCGATFFHWFDFRTTPALQEPRHLLGP